MLLTVFWKEIMESGCRKYHKFTSQFSIMTIPCFQITKARDFRTKSKFSPKKIISNQQTL